MIKAKDFEINRKGVLTKYLGKGGDVVIPDGVTEIDREVFMNQKNLTSVTVPEGCKNIGDRAFIGCAELKSVILAGGTLSIGRYAFKECRNLTSVTLAEGLTSIYASAFSGCWELADILLPNSLVFISGHVFHGCKKLAAVTIPSGVKEVGEMTFANCDALKTITFLGDVKDVGGNLLYMCGDVTIIGSEKSFSAFWEKAKKYEYCVNSLKNGRSLHKSEITYIRRALDSFFEIALKDDNVALLEKLITIKGKIPLETLDRYIGQSTVVPGICAYLLEYKARLYPPAVVEKIERIAEEKEIGLIKKTVADWKKVFRFSSYEDGLVITGRRVSDAVLEIPKIIGKKQVLKIGDYALCGYDALVEVIIPDSLKEIGRHAFQGCKNLETITIPKSVTTIGENAFHNCPKLTVHAPKGSRAKRYASKNNIPFVAE